ncbi:MULTISPECIES: hypothetical protein [Lysobacter]|uniref:Uncharacterized protein n=1 Tax=Lysobacter firmicutimachus TaxID=1792846 RepID=A0ABU8D9R1_9GAMM|nr:hypothetical protein [Lysobacter antibioticus]
MDENLHCLLHMELEGLFDPLRDAAAPPACVAPPAARPAGADLADTDLADTDLAEAVLARLRQPDMRATLERLATQLRLH